MYPGRRWLLSAKHWIEFGEGLLFFHFFGIDQDSHMLWGRYDDELLETYKIVDTMLGSVREKVRDAALLVVSDHGFAPFTRAVHLNTWLLHEDFLALTGPARTGEDELFANVEWSRTKAYSLGLNGIYVNRQSRERTGIVAPGEESEQVILELRRRLLDLRDPKGGKPVVQSVAVTRELFKIGSPQRAPDLIVGYAPGYRSSWQSALGGVPAPLIEDNLDEWRGDHCIDPQFVPGVLLSNRRGAVEDPRIEDLTVTIMHAFDVAKMQGMRGRDLYPKAQ